MNFIHTLPALTHHFLYHLFLYHSRFADAGAQQLKEEEARLKRVREELAEQRAQFEKRKVAAQGDLNASEQMRLALMAAREEVGKERLQVERLARDLQAASERVALRGESLEAQVLIITLTLIPSLPP